VRLKILPWSSGAEQWTMATDSALQPPTELAKTRLRGNIGRLQYFALGFGTIIGSAWVVLLGDWLRVAGPGGAILGFLSGGAMMMVIGCCYTELIGQLPEAGTEFIYGYRVFGRVAGFAVGWFLILYLVGVTVYEALALPWVLELLVPSFQGATLYRAFGAPVTADALAIGIVVALVITCLNLMGVQAAIGFHFILTFVFISVGLVILVLMLIQGHAANAAPLWGTTNGRPWWLGTGSLFAFCAYALNGFQAIPQMVEERSDKVPLRVVCTILVASIGAATVFYCIVILSASFAAPWRALASAPLATAAAAAYLPHGRLISSVLLCVTAVSLLKAWNGIFMMAVRLLLAMARVGLFPERLANAGVGLKSPWLAILVIALLNVFGIFLGRGAVEPVTDMCAMVLTLTYVMCCAAVLRLRKGPNGTPANARVSSGLVWGGMLGGAVMTCVAFASPFWNNEERFPLAWRLVLAWSMAGLVFLALTRYRQSNPV
jgi:basic amino acid/polyamine antiporter, APA family